MPGVDLGAIAGMVPAARSVASLATAPRMAVRQNYDAILGDLARADLPSSFLQAQVLGHRALTLLERPLFEPMGDVDAFALALAALGSREALANVAVAMVAMGIFDGPPGGKPTDLARERNATAAKVTQAAGFAQVPMMATTTAAAQRGTAEVMVDPRATWVDPALLSPSILLAIRRVCRITAKTAEGLVTGTGFLVGPSAVLTNWHVVNELIAAFPTRLEPSMLWVHFDGLRSGLPAGGETEAPVRTEGWLLAHSAMGPLEPAGAAHAWWTDKTKRAEWQGSVAKNLDFAVIALDSSPGEQRGWYDLSKASTATPDGSVFVFHHPEGRPMAITGGSVVFSDGLQPVRVFHSASTRGGSSGGLLVDDNGIPTALHHAGYGDARLRADGTSPNIPADAVNAAVPLAAIRTAIGAPLSAQIASTSRLSLSRSCLDGKRPLFGRADLVDAIDVVVNGARRILWVKPPEAAFRRPGKTFSVEVLKALMPPPRNVYVEMTADRVKAGGRAMAGLILEALSPAFAAGLPEVGDSGTTETAYYENQLISHIRDRLAEGYPTSRVWLVVDDLDIATLTDAGGRRFLDVLYRRCNEIEQLRIVLVGLRVALPGIPEDMIRLSSIDLGEFVDIGRLFQAWLNSRGARDRPIEPRVMRLIGDALASYAGADAPLEKLADFASRHFATPLDAFLAD